MADEEKTKLHLEVAHVLFMDIVGYSKLLVDEQGEALHELNALVRKTEAVQAAETAGQLILLPTGDGMALVFTSSVEAPVECALQIGQALRAQPSLPLRMGIHSGPVQHVEDVNGRENIAGSGINIAQRVMDCGDAGHILVSRRVADDLVGTRRWQPYLHELGEVEVKHGLKVSLVNVYADAVGNPAPPQKFGSTQATRRPLVTGTRSVHPAARRWLTGSGALLIVAALVFGLWRRNIVNREGMPATVPLSSTSPAGVMEKSVAVLPFANLSTDKDNAFFADGVQDEVLTDLSRVADLKVISRTSVMQYRDASRNLSEIGQALGVAYVVEGSVQRAGNKIRVTAQLIDARTDAHRWAEHYDRDLADVFAIQSEIAQAIAGQLQATISPREKAAIERPATSNFAAYDLYVRATTLINTAEVNQTLSENLLQAIYLLDDAVGRDPAFLLAYCKLADAHDRLYRSGFDHTVTRLSLAETAAKNALRVQPDSGDAHLALAYHFYSQLEYERALEESAAARLTLPNDPRIFMLGAYIDRQQSRWVESATNTKRALESDPRNLAPLNVLSWNYEMLRDYPAAAATMDRILTIEPTSMDARLGRARIEISWRADPRPLHTFKDVLLREDPAWRVRLAPMWVYLALCERDPVAAESAAADMGENTFGPSAVQFGRTFTEGLIARMKGDAAAAQTAFGAARVTQERVVSAQPDYAPALCVLGLIDAALGHKEDALREGRRAEELLPTAKDSVNGPSVTEFLVVIYAWAGEKDLAAEHFRTVLLQPGPGGYGQFKLLPFWDPLRGDARFEALVASLAPK